jgi:hypothetical protein
MHCLCPIRVEERLSADVPDWPTIAYWKRLAAGVSVNVDGREENLAIGLFRTGSLHLPSVVDCIHTGPTPDHRMQAQLAVDSMKRCAGVVVVFRSDMPAMAEVRMETLRADFRRVGRRLEDLPVVLQATFQDQDAPEVEVVSAVALGATVGIPADLCVPSVAHKCVGVREALSTLVRRIRSRAAS